MLSELYIENLAVIEKTSIKFDKGFNVFTGETGAGKSIVIDALNAVLGQRTSSSIVRHGTNKATIVASFTDVSESVAKKLAELSYPIENGELIIQREISVDGKGSAKLMGKPITISMLREIGTTLINIHGQHDNQVLLSRDRHIDILDSYGELENQLKEYYDCYKSVVLIKREIKKLSANEQDKSQKIDLLSYQITDIEQGFFTTDELENLEKRRLEIKNHMKIVKALNGGLQALKPLNGDSGAVELLRYSTSVVGEVSELLDSVEPINEKLNELFYEADELANTIESLLDSMEIKQGEQEVVDNRLEEINALRRKYGSTSDEVSTFLDSIKQELSDIKLSDKRLLELDKQGTAEFSRLLSLGANITEQRKKAAKKFIEKVTGELVFLDMPNVRLQVEMSAVKPNAKGQDAVEFLISTNKGEPPKPIAKIASGGELSRIMLAIKNSLADKDDIPTLIFDEIDTGVSGRAAQKIGLKLHEAAQNRQIISVTHLAQIAALSDHHFLIKKDSDEESTHTSVTKLDLDERVTEVARIMSTDKISDLMLQSAREMILDK